MIPLAKTAAFFDVDRTLLPRRSMESIFLPYLIKNGYLKGVDLVRFLAGLAKTLDEAGEEGWLRNNKYHLKDKDPASLRRLAAECFQAKIRPRISPAGRKMVGRHLRQGHLVVLLTGTLDPLAQELREDLGVHLALAARLGTEGGAYSGRLEGIRPYGAEKARLVKELAGEAGIDLANSFAYGDHHTDEKVLSQVGNPVAVNPDAKLAATARQRGWPIIEFL